MAQEPEPGKPLSFSTLGELLLVTGKVLSVARQRDSCNREVRVWSEHEFSTFSSGETPFCSSEKKLLSKWKLLFRAYPIDERKRTPFNPTAIPFMPYLFPSTLQKRKVLIRKPEELAITVP